MFGELPNKSSWQKSGEWIDFGLKDTINKLKIWLKFCQL